MKVLCLHLSPPIGALLISNHVKVTSANKSITFDCNSSKENLVQYPDGSKRVYQTVTDLARLLARYGNEDDLLGRNALEKSEVDSWLCFAANQLAQRELFEKAVTFLNRSTTQGKFLVGGRITIADFMVLAGLVANPMYKPSDNVLKWFNRVRTLPAVKKSLAASPEFFQGTILSTVAVATSNDPAFSDAPTRMSADRHVPVEKLAKTGERLQEGKFVDLPGAEMGKVVVRFPPEASGYLHIGHAKAALLNQYYQQAFRGLLIMRFDDTNPAKEDVHFERVILEDVAMLDIEPDLFTHTSQYFDEMLGYCEQLLRSGDAYVDDTEGEQMKQEREARIESSNRNNTYAKNFKMWEEMKLGSEFGQKCCVRAKINMQSLNGCMRDPTIYRCKNEPHARTGTTYKVYPTYDFACPIVDAIENVTHTLRTMEYHDRDEQFYWFIEKLHLRRPYIWEYSRLSMTNTVLSKRKLTWFVQNGHVDGWDDPRMPTVRGVLRRGMTVEGLKQFIIAQGSSRSVVFMEWDKIWAFNKKVIDPIAPRFTALDYNNTVQVNVRGVKTERLDVAKHPKNTDVGMKVVWISDIILIEMTDALQLKEGENTTFINWGNLLIKKINKENGVIKSIDAEPNLENKDYKKTLKLTWLAKVDEATFTPTYCVYFEHIISKALLGKDEDFKEFIAKDTRKEVQMLGDPELKKLKHGDIIQLQRIGFFKVDIAYQPANPHTCREQPIVLFYIPDGHTKESPNVNVGKTGGKTEEKQPSPQKTDNPASVRTLSDINTELNTQADIVRDLKSKKASKTDIDTAVKLLLALKVEYKTATGTDWKQGAVPPASAVTQPPSTQFNASTPRISSTINAELNTQADIVRDLKAKKASKADIDTAVKLLLNLKVEYKTTTGTDWKQVAATSAVTEPTPTQSNTSARTSSVINTELNTQADLVRDLKAKKASKADIDTAVKLLLVLKAEYNTGTGTDWKQGAASPAIAAIEPTQMQSNVSTPRTPSTINAELNTQADLVRDLKAKKVSKADIDTAVKLLLVLKAEYKTGTGTDWKQSAAPPASAVFEPTQTQSNASTPCTPLIINTELNTQADLVRDLKAQKASKADIDTAVKRLLNLKVEYKTTTGTDWKQGSAPPASAVIEPTQTQSNASTPRTPSTINAELKTQADLVRDLKAQKASKADIDTAVKRLLVLKAEYKTTTETDWKQGAFVETQVQSMPASGTAPAAAAGDNKVANQLTATVNTQADVVRGLKSKGAAKEDIEQAVKELLDLKAEYKTLTGSDFPAAGRGNSNKESKSKDTKKEKVKPAAKDKPLAKDDDAAQKKQTRLCIEAKKEESFSSWYSEVITKGEMIEYYDVSGCYILRPWSFAIWDAIREWFDAEIKKLGVQNCYFPIFVSKAVLEKEKTHIADFAPEVAWVTRSGNSEMAEPIAVRPTSETVMYPAYAKWIQSHRDLPIKLNQWNNVVRWEFSNPQPFLRTREFLWQEGHTAHAEADDAQAEVRTILELYARVYTDLLAVPVIHGRKTEKEKFAGGEYTTTVEAYVGASGRAVQGATSHFLGQNFSRMFDITYEVPGKNEKKYVEQNSWGISTRSIGVMIMIHGDNTGLVLPPRIACIQTVIVPCGITAKSTDDDRSELQRNCAELEAELRASGVRVHGDYRDNQTPGWKYSHWELKGVPLRIEYGPKDIEKSQLVAVRRDTGEKITIQRPKAGTDINALLDNIQKNLYNNALRDMESHKTIAKTWDVFCTSLDNKFIILAPFCGGVSCEEKIKADSARTDTENVEPGAPSMGGKSLCIPFDQPAAILSTDKCVHPACSDKPQFYTLFGRSY